MKVPTFPLSTATVLFDVKRISPACTANKAMSGLT
jgi:hypothetical protein